MPSSNGYEQLKSDEGFTPKATYLKKQGGGRESVRTIGYGYNIDANEDPRMDLLESGVPESEVDDVLAGKKGISEEQAGVLFDKSVRRASTDAARVIANFDRLDKPVQDVLINMSYQLGGKGLKEFKRMRVALLEDDYTKAAKEILNSSAARNDSTHRYERLSKKMMEYAESVKPEPVAKKTTAEAYKDRRRQVLARELGSLYSRANLARDLGARLTTVTKSKEKEESNARAQ